MRPHTHTQPKVLMTVAGKPILAHILDDLRDLPLDEVTFVVGHLAEKVEEFVREHYPYRVDFVHQEEPLGNGHAIYVARDKLDGPTLIVFGDTIVQADLTHALRLPHSSIGVHRVPDPRAFGVVEVDRDGFVRRRVENRSSPRPTWPWWGSTSSGRLSTRPSTASSRRGATSWRSRTSFSASWTTGATCGARCWRPGG